MINFSFYPQCFQDTCPQICNSRGLFGKGLTMMGRMALKKEWIHCLPKNAILLDKPVILESCQINNDAKSV